MKNNIAIFLLLLLPAMVSAQKSMVEGIVLKENSAGQQEPVEAAQIFWLDGSGLTFTDAQGEFQLEGLQNQSSFAVSYVGLGQDTILVGNESFFEIILSEGIELETVQVKYKKKTTEVSMLNPRLIQSMSEKELGKAACCNLSESFVTNPSVDMSITDAVSGTKQIRMLGIDGPNVLYSQENIPAIRGFSSLHGLQFIPGPWVKSIQVSKGTGSVVNGFEGVSGQINVELKKADDGEKAHFNAYINRQSRAELNGNYRAKVNDQISFSILGHAASRTTRNDVNLDGFLDQPINKEYGLTNRWRYVGDNGWRSRLVIESSMIDQIAGQKNFEKNSPSSIWGLASKIQRHGAWAKLGKIYKNTPWRSFGMQLKVNYFDHDSRYGLRNYHSSQRSLYYNFIYQSIIGNMNQVIKIGANVSADNFDESLDEISFDRNEIIPGIFSELEYNPSEKISVIAGIRADHHNLYGLMITPRLHLRYSPTLTTALRASVGKARRTANIISDNIGFLASNRTLKIEPSHQKGAYSLPQTESWNFGTSIQKRININQKELTIIAEFYHTQFINSIIVDRDLDSRMIVFYEQIKDNYSNSFQFQADYELVSNLNFRLAYRWLEVQIDYIDGKNIAPLTAQNRYFANVAYSYNSSWDFDYTLNWIGKQRLPNTNQSPEEFQFEEESPSFFTHNFQVMKHFRPNFNMYIGGENLFGFRQEKTILNAENPFNDYFDASMIWGPTNNAIVYLGLKYNWN